MSDHEISVSVKGRLLAVLGRNSSAVFTPDGAAGPTGEEVGKAIARALPTVYFDREVEIVVRWRESD